MRRLLLPLLLLLLCLPAAAAASTKGPCVPGSTITPTCTMWDGKVAWVDDGDTVHVKLRGVRSPLHVRITGIQAMELSVYGDHRRRQGACHAVDATDRLEQLVKQAKGRVRLIAQHPESRSGRRYRRSVALRINGRWKDVGRTLLTEGLALWLPNGAEYAWNARYSTLAERAAAARVGLWNASYCGEGPNEGQPIKLWANWDADGVEVDNLTGPNGEWVRIKNLDPVNPLPLAGWWLRDSDLRQYSFPEYALVQPGGTITVHVGTGEDSESDLYWGLRDPVFDNVRPEQQSGDGAYLFDPQGDLRSYMSYPCRSTCADANAGALDLRAKVRGREEILVRNGSDHAVGLEDYRVTTSGGHVYTFAPDTVLEPRQTLRLVPRRHPEDDGALTRGWGKDWTILRNGGGTIRLSSFRNAVIACMAWGDRSC